MIHPVVNICMPITHTSIYDLSCRYKQMEKDPAGFDMGFSRSGAKGFAIYAAASDHLAADYNARGGGTEGSCVLCLLLVKEGAGPGAYEQYHLGSARTSAAGDNAFAIRDARLILPLGYVHAKKARGGKRKRG